MSDDNYDYITVIKLFIIYFFVQLLLLSLKDSDICKVQEGGK